jgi:ABC-type cobalamin/Fe3+-siderophores transport system ATPase subunit
LCLDLPGVVGGVAFVEHASLTGHDGEVGVLIVLNGHGKTSVLRRDPTIRHDPPRSATIQRS